MEWKSTFSELAGRDKLDLVADLMPLNVGLLYRELEDVDSDRRTYGRRALSTYQLSARRRVLHRYGWIPTMASSSYGQIGALNAESFCERVLRCAGHVLTEGNTLLDDAELQMHVVLRMNRKFMEFMRKNYQDELKEAFGKTIVENV